MTKELLSNYWTVFKPPYKIGDLGVIFVTALILLTIPLTVIATYQRFSYKAKAATPDQIKAKIIELVGTRQTPEPVRSWGYQNFGMFLWGLSGCESGHNDQVIAYDRYGQPIYFGLFQFSPTTWKEVHEAMGIPTRDIMDGLAQIDTVIYMIDTHYGTGVENWPACTDGIDVIGNREWNSPSNLEGWPDTINGIPMSAFTGQAPSPSVPGAIKGAKSGLDAGVSSMAVWLDAGSPATSNNSFNFSNLSAGTHKVHIQLNPNNQLLAQAKYTLCTSLQPDCGAPGDPRKYHWLNNLKAPQIYSPNEAYFQVSIPSGGFVDIRILYPPLGLPPCISTNEPKLYLVKTVEAATCDSTLVPMPPPPPKVEVARNVPACSDTLYGGTQYYGSAPNIETLFKVSNATKAQMEAYEDGVKFFDYTWSNLNPPVVYNLGGLFWNLSPGKNYSWRVRAGNGGGWSNWVGGYAWKVLPCTKPDLVGNIYSLEATANPALVFDSNTGKYYGKVGQTVRFRGYVSNRTLGIVDRSFNVRWLINDTQIAGYILSGNTSLQTSTHGPVAPNSSEVAGHDSSIYTFNTAGTYYIKFCADSPTSVISESNETNNCEVETLVITNNTPPDLKPYDCDFNANSVCLLDKNGVRRTSFVAGDTVTAQFKLSSDNSLASNFWIDLWNIAGPTSGCNVGGSSGYRYITQMTSSPATYTISFKAPASPGSYWGSMIVDSRGSSSYCSVSETEERNNWAIFQYSVVDPNLDSDGDGFKNGVEVYVGTDPFQRCASTTALSDEADDRWPADLNDDKALNRADLDTFTSPIYRLNTSSGQANYSPRWDLNANGKIDLSDLTLLVTLYPPMFNGQRAYGGPSCSPN